MTELEQLRAENARLAQALAWYGWKMVPDWINDGQTEVTTQLGKRARDTLAESPRAVAWLDAFNTLMDASNALDDAVAEFGPDNRFISEVLQYWHEALDRARMLREGG